MSSRATWTLTCQDCSHFPPPSSRLHLVIVWCANKIIILVIVCVCLPGNGASWYGWTMGAPFIRPSNSVALGKQIDPALFVRTSAVSANEWMSKHWTLLGHWPSSSRPSSSNHHRGRLPFLRSTTDAHGERCHASYGNSYFPCPPIFNVLNDSALLHLFFRKIHICSDHIRFEWKHQGGEQAQAW